MRLHQANGIYLYNLQNNQNHHHPYQNNLIHIDYISLQYSLSYKYKLHQDHMDMDQQKSKRSHQL